MILDELMPVYDLRTRHERIVPAAREQVYAVARLMTIRTLWPVRVLLWIRELPSRLLGLPLEDFPVVAERPGHEVVRAICGRFWAFSGNILDIPVAEIAAFEKPGFGKAYWSFSVEELVPGQSRLVTELRVRLYDEASRKKFSRYWVLVGPFSGWIRVRCLEAIAKGL
jgi:hypothetical protein